LKICWNELQNSFLTRIHTALLCNVGSGVGKGLRVLQPRATAASQGTGALLLWSRQHAKAASNAQGCCAGLGLGQAGTKVQRVQACCIWQLVLWG